MRSSDLPIVEGWYKHKGEMMPPAEYQDLGYVIQDDIGAPVACGWILRTFTKLALFEYFQTTPRMPVMVQARQLRLLALYMINEAHRLGFTALLGIVSEDKPGLGRYYKRLGCASSGRKFIFYHLGGE